MTAKRGRYGYIALAVAVVAVALLALGIPSADPLMKYIIYSGFSGLMVACSLIVVTKKIATKIILACLVAVSLASWVSSAIIMFIALDVGWAVVTIICQLLAATVMTSLIVNMTEARSMGSMDADTEADEDK